MSKYVALSRAKDLYQLFIIADWNGKVLRKQPPPEVQAEMARLNNFNNQTRLYVQSLPLFTACIPFVAH